MEKKKGYSRIWKGSNFFVQSQHSDDSVRQFLKMIDFGKKYGASVKVIMPDCVDMSFPNKEAMEAYIKETKNN